MYIDAVPLNAILELYAFRVTCGLKFPTNYIVDTSDFKLNSLVFFLIFVVFMSDFNTCFVRTSTVIAECGILVFTYSIYNNFLYKKIDMFIVE